MKTSKLIISFAILCMAILTAKAQNEVAQPGSFVKHGNTSSNVPSVPAALELTDSVTVTAAIKYWVQPDASLLNPSNTYTWVVAPAALGAQTAGSPTNLATITIGNAPTAGTITVTEATAAGCPGTTTTINVQSVAKPTGTFTTASSSVCAANVATITLPLTTTLTTPIANGAVKVTYTITDPSNATGAPQVVVLSQASSNFTLPAGTFNAYGVWKITITNIDDRISMKSNVAGVVGATPVYDFTISKTPTTGSIFHLPNN